MVSGSLLVRVFCGIDPRLYGPENCPAPSNASGYSIANNICTLARPFGVVKLFKAYLEIPDQTRSITLRSELQSSGVSLVDCPHNGRKEVADKMLLG
jgi:hypothetical protein